MYWANFLHIYQPPTQRPSILGRVVNESYRRIIAELKKAPHARLTLNITGCLTELLAKQGYKDVIEGLKTLLKRGQLELTASAKYHPLLPKLPREEVIRQIELDLETNKKYFGSLYNPRGFFPPEAAYNRELAKIVADMGFEWILAEELSYDGHFNHVKYDRCYEVEGIHPLMIFFRERETSFKILSGQLGTIKLFEEHLGERITRNEYLLTAMDGETFGHHRPGMEKLLFEIYRSGRIKTVTISELPKIFAKKETVKTLPSTWALMEKDLERKAPFSRWDDPENEIHKLQWQLTKLAISTVRNSKMENQPSTFDLLDPSSTLRSPPSPERKQWLKARKMLDRALHSDQYWWASARPWWSLEMIEAGAKELRDAVLAVPDAGKKEKEQAKGLYYRIIFLGFEWQRGGKVEEIARREDEEIRERTDEALPKLPREEVKKMIDNLKKEMEDVAGRQEYERAVQLRDRIKELKEYLLA